MLVFGFDADLAATTAEDFVGELLARRFGAAGVVTGEDFTFGKSRGGNVRVLAELGTVHGLRALLLPGLLSSGLLSLGLLLTALVAAAGADIGIGAPVGGFVRVSGEVLGALPNQEPESKSAQSPALMKLSTSCARAPIQSR